MFKEPVKYTRVCKMQPCSVKTELFGEFHGAVDFITKNQLIDRDMWRDTVRQFAIKPDTWQWRGEFWGKLMRGGCLIYEYTQDEELYTVLEQSVHALLAVQRELGSLSTYKDEFCGWDIWCRKYVLLGMQYFHRICRDSELKCVLVRAMRTEADTIMAGVGDGEGKKRLLDCSSNWGGMNSASVLEPFVCLYMLTGEDKYLAFADTIVRGGCVKGFNIFEAAHEGKLLPYQYAEQKAYEMMSCFEGLLDYYLVSGEEKHLQTVISFAAAVMKSDITVIGSAGTTHELFDNSALHQCDPEYNGIMQETCVTVTWMKLCSRLLLLTGDGVYGDEIERSAYNALLGAVNFGKDTYEGKFYPIDSYSPLCGGVRRRKMGGEMVLSENRTMGCCIAIAAAGIALVPLMTASLRDDGPSLNLYSQSRIICEYGQLEVKTEYPYDGRVSIHLTQGGGEFALYLRIPGWSKKTSVTVNGEEVAVSAQDGYIRIYRAWATGDCTELLFDMSMRTVSSQSLGAKPGYMSFSRGCICYALENYGDGIYDPAKTESALIPYARAGGGQTPFTAWIRVE